MEPLPITFSNALIPPLRAGRKTQTRRLMWNKAQGSTKPRRSLWFSLLPGRVLWVREQWTVAPACIGGHYLYGGDPCMEGQMGDHPRGWKPARFMPREACRFRLEVQDVRFQHAQDITAEDAIAEGLEQGPLGWGVPPLPGTWTEDPREAFGRLWDEIHDHPNTFSDNPEVVAITFRLLEPEPAAHA